MHILAPLTNLCSSKTEFKWSDAKENSLFTEDVLLRFLDHIKPFETFIDTSQYQIDATIKQNILPIADFSKKLTQTQRMYSTIEQEMLAIVEVLKEYCNFLLGVEIPIYTDDNFLKT